MQTPELGSWDEIEAITGWRPAPVIYEMPDHIEQMFRCNQLDIEDILRVYGEWEKSHAGIEQLWIDLEEAAASVDAGAFVWDEEQKFLKWTRLADPERWGNAGE